MVRDGHGCYRPADADQILEAARQVIEQKMQRGASFNSPTAVTDYLRAKLTGFEHEVFAVMVDKLTLQVLRAPSPVRTLQRAAG